MIYTKNRLYDEKTGIIYNLSFEEDVLLVRLISLNGVVYNGFVGYRYEKEVAKEFWLKLAMLADCSQMREDLFALEKGAS